MNDVLEQRSFRRAGESAEQILRPDRERYQRRLIGFADQWKLLAEDIANRRAVEGEPPVADLRKERRKIVAHFLRPRFVLVAEKQRSRPEWRDGAGRFDSLERDAD